MPPLPWQPSPLPHTQPPDTGSPWAPRHLLHIQSLRSEIGAARVNSLSVIVSQSGGMCSLQNGPVGPNNGTKTVAAGKQGFNKRWGSSQPLKRVLLLVL